MLRFGIGIVIFLSVALSAAQVKNIQDVMVSDFLTETQIMFEEKSGTHVAMAWWIPNEYWQAAMANDVTMSSAQKDDMLKSLDGFSILAVLQGDVNSMGIINFYPQAEVDKGMKVQFVDAKGKATPLKAETNLNSDLKLLLDVFKPILQASMGNMGQNLHFFVYNDKSSSGRVLDPYKSGKINIEVTPRGKQKLKQSIELPLNSLFVPRICPNGREAHISWSYCPWGGEKLD